MTYVDAAGRPWDEHNTRILLDLSGRAYTVPGVYAMVPLLEQYPRSPKLDDQVGARLPRSMKAKLRDLKERHGLRFADVVRIGCAEVLRRADERPRP